MEGGVWGEGLAVVGRPRWGNRLCFLGFGFNLSRLNITAALGHLHRRPWIVASMLNKTTAEMDSYKVRAIGPDPNVSWHPYGANNSNTLRQSGILL